MKATTRAGAVSGYLPNWMNKYEVGERPIGSTEPVLKELAQGIQTVDPSNDEDTEEFEYYGDRGGKSKTVTTISSEYAFKGHRDYKNDEAQEFVRDRLNQTGAGREVYFRHTEPDGRVREGNAILTGIVHTGGDANQRGNFECVIGFDGLPKDSKDKPEKPPVETPKVSQ